jgi:hypothetical protein
MHPETEDLLTRWITGEGAKHIMEAAGIIPHEIPIPKFCVSRRNRETYLWGLLFAAAYAVAERSANPAAMAPLGAEHAFRSHGERAIKKWAQTSAHELEKLLEAL